MRTILSLWNQRYQRLVSMVHRGRQNVIRGDSRRRLKRERQGDNVMMVHSLVPRTWPGNKARWCSADACQQGHSSYWNRHGFMHCNLHHSNQTIVQQCSLISLFTQCSSHNRGSQSVTMVSMVTYFSPEVESPMEGTWVGYRQEQMMYMCAYQTCYTGLTGFVWFGWR